jgi:hypothetical protein
MKVIKLILLICGIATLCSCTFFDAKHPDEPAPVESHHKPLAIPIGHNWQIVEEAPKLTDQSGRLPFQREESVLPDGGKSEPPPDNRRIEIPK